MNKPFDRALFAENDKKARDAVKAWFKDSEIYTLIDNPKKMGVDLLLYVGDEHVGNIEVEVKRVWKGDFSYDSVQFPQRKAKYAQLNKPTLFVMFSADFSQFLTVTGADLLSSPLAVVPNRYVYQGEQFYQVPLDKVTFNQLLMG
jgi:hypothetical protein